MVPLSQHELENVLGDGGYCLGVYVLDQLVGFHATYFPTEMDQDNLGYDAGLPKKSLRSVAHLESVFIHPEYRGNGLQKKMTALLLTFIQTQKQYEFVFITIAPQNVASLINVLSCGVNIIQFKKKYGGFDRYILFQYVNEPEQLDMLQAKMISYADFEQQKTLLEQGFRGYEARLMEDALFINFAPLLTVNRIPATTRKMRID